MPIPPSIQIQLARLFGTNSRETKKSERSIGQWKKILKKTLDELFKYAEHNVRTDDLHWLMICSGFAAANEALDSDDFWPGFTEGIMRVCFLLMGDYPDHRSYKGGARKSNHYMLNRFRTMEYIQSTDQKKFTLQAASAIRFPNLTVSFYDALSQFRREEGIRGGSADFLRWFRKNYPSDYSQIF